eukprot:Mrub_06755.p1 GENE.Mrub_06755~~Mrub_06755.p1  ORF type:complete len:260 (-),score=68.45 Mrub_06755:199-930(-)
MEKQKNKSKDEVLDDDIYYDINGNPIKKQKNITQTKDSNKNDTVTIKKGFFDKPKNKSKDNSNGKLSNSKPLKDNNIVDVKHNPENNSLVFDDVQKSMQEIKKMDPKSYITNDLLQKMGSDPEMVKMFQDQEFMQVMQMGKDNPKAIAEYIKKYPSKEAYIKKFCGLMGTHFQDKAKEELPVDDEATQMIAKDIHVQNFLQWLMNEAKNGRKVDYRQVLHTNPQLREKIDFLVKKGLIRIDQV